MFALYLRLREQTLLTISSLDLAMALDQEVSQVFLSSPRVNWAKLAAVKRFLSLAQTTASRPPAQLMVGGKYRIGKKIANGAFGQLRLVTDVITGEDLAIKGSFPKYIFLDLKISYNLLSPEKVLPCTDYLIFESSPQLEPENAKIPQLFLEFDFYKRLGPYIALPRVHYYGKGRFRRENLQ